LFHRSDEVCKDINAFETLDVGPDAFGEEFERVGLVAGVKSDFLLD